MSHEVPVWAPVLDDDYRRGVAEVLDGHILSIGPRIERFEPSWPPRRTGASRSACRPAPPACTDRAGPAGRPATRSSRRRSRSSPANCLLFVGAKPVFVDIDPASAAIDVAKVAAAITPSTEASSRSKCSAIRRMVELEQIAERHELALIEDACERSAGAGTRGSARRRRQVGRGGRVRVLSQQADHHRRRRHDRHRRRHLRRHLPRRSATRAARAWRGSRTSRLGYNYRLTEINAALGIAQARRLTRSSPTPQVARRVHRAADDQPLP